MSKKARIKRKMRRALGALVKSEGAHLDFAAAAIALTEESAYDQPCGFGRRCGEWAVYCNNWVLPLPRKCRRSWHYQNMTDVERQQQKLRDEDCPGFLPNPRGKK